MAKRACRVPAKRAIIKRSRGHSDKVRAVHDGVRTARETIAMPQQLANHSTMTVQELMHAPVETVHMDTPVRVAKRLFDEKRYHHLVVMEKGHVFGVVSDRDILKIISPFVGSKTMEREQDTRTLRQRVHQVMSRKPVTVEPTTLVSAAAKKILSERVSCLPVVTNAGELVGILTVRDIVSWAAGLSDGLEALAAQPESVAAGLDHPLL